MLRKNKNKEKGEKPKYFLPTEEEMLSFRPIRADYEYTTKDDGCIQLKIPKFQGKSGKSLVKIMRKDEMFNANLDKIGTVVWNNCDGKKTVKQILNILKKEFSDQEDIDQRLYLFLQQMRNLNYIYF